MLFRSAVFVNDYNSNGDLINSYYAPNETVFIIYGSKDSIFDDSRRSNFDGTYQFSDLFAGDYTLFAYSKCSTCSSGVEPIFATVTVEHKGMEIDAPLITINK